MKITLLTVAAQQNGVIDNSKTKASNIVHNKLSGLIYEGPGLSNPQPYNYSQLARKQKYKPTINISEDQATYYQSNPINQTMNENRRRELVVPKTYQLKDQKIMKNVPTGDNSQSPLVVLHQRNRETFKKGCEQIAINKPQTIRETQLYQTNMSNKKALDWGRLLSLVRKSENVDSLIKNQPEQEYSVNQTSPVIGQLRSKEKIRKKRVVCNSLDKHLDKRSKRTSNNHILKGLTNVSGLENNLVERTNNFPSDPNKSSFVDSRHAAKLVKHLGMNNLNIELNNNLKKEMNVTLSAINILMNSKPNAIKSLYKSGMSRKKPRSTVSSKRRIRRVKHKLPTVHEEKVLKTEIIDVISNGVENQIPQSKAHRENKYSNMAKESKNTSKILPRNNLEHETGPQRLPKPKGSLLPNQERTVKDLSSNLLKTNKSSRVVPGNEGQESFIIIPSITDNSQMDSKQPIFLKKKIKMNDLQGVEGYVVKNFFSSKDSSKLSENQSESADGRLLVDTPNKKEKHKNRGVDKMQRMKINKNSSFQQDRVLFYYANKESCSTSKESLKIAIRRDVETSDKGSSNVLNVVIKQTKNSRSNIETSCLLDGKNDHVDGTSNNDRVSFKNQDDEETHGVSSECTSSSPESKTHNTTDTSTVTSNQSTQCTGDFCALNCELTSSDSSKATRSQEMGKDPNVISSNDIAQPIPRQPLTEAIQDNHVNDKSQNNADCAESLSTTMKKSNTVDQLKPGSIFKSTKINEVNLSRLNNSFSKKLPENTTKSQKAALKPVLYKESEVNILQQKLIHIGLSEKKSFVKLVDSKSSLCQVSSTNQPNLRDIKLKNKFNKPLDNQVNRVEIKIMKSPSFLISERRECKVGIKQYPNVHFLKESSFEPTRFVTENSTFTGQKEMNSGLEKSQFFTILNTEEVGKKCIKENISDGLEATRDSEIQTEKIHIIPIVNDVAIQTDPILSFNQPNSDKANIEQNFNSSKRAKDKKSSLSKLENHILGKKQSFVHIIYDEPKEGVQNQLTKLNKCTKDILKQEGLELKSIAVSDGINSSVENDNKKDKKLFDKIDAISHFLQYLNQTLDVGHFTKTDDYSHVASRVGQFNQTLKSLSENCIEIVGKMENNRALSQPLNRNTLPPTTINIAEEPCLKNAEKMSKFVNVVSQEREEEWRKDDPSRVSYINISEVNNRNNRFKSNKGDNHFMFLPRHQNPFFVVVPSDESINNTLEKKCYKTVKPSEYKEYCMQMKDLILDKLNLEDEMENMLLKRKIMNDLGKGDFTEYPKEVETKSIESKYHKHGEKSINGTKLCVNRNIVQKGAEKYERLDTKSKNAPNVYNQSKSKSAIFKSISHENFSKSKKQGNISKQMFLDSPNSTELNCQSIGVSDTNKCSCQAGKKGHSKKNGNKKLKNNLLTHPLMVDNRKSEQPLIPDGLLLSKHLLPRSCNDNQENCKKSGCRDTDSNLNTNNRCHNVLLSPKLCDQSEQSKGSVSRNRLHSSIKVSLDHKNKDNLPTEYKPKIKKKKPFTTCFKSSFAENISTQASVSRNNELKGKNPQTLMPKNPTNAYCLTDHGMMNGGWPWNNKQFKFYELSTTSGSGSDTSVGSSWSQENLKGNTTIFAHGLLPDKQSNGIIAIKSTKSLTNVFAAVSPTMEKDLISPTDTHNNCLNTKIIQSFKNIYHKSSIQPNLYPTAKDDSKLSKNSSSNPINVIENSTANFKEPNYDLKVNDSEFSIGSSFSEKRPLVFTNRLIPAFKMSREDVKAFGSCDVGGKCVNTNSDEEMLKKTSELQLRDTNGWISLSNYELHNSSRSKVGTKHSSENNIHQQMDFKSNDVMHVVLFPTS